LLLVILVSSDSGLIGWCEMGKVRYTVASSAFERRMCCPCPCTTA